MMEARLAVGAEFFEFVNVMQEFLIAHDREKNAGNTFELAVEDPTWTPDPMKCFIRKIPFDTPAVIFNHVVDAYRDMSRRLDTMHTRAPLNIARVCKSWREVALEIPSLWTQIGPSSAPFIHTFLARSKSEILDIFWNPTKLPSPTGASQGPDRAISFFRPLRDHVHRLKRLDIWYTPLSVYERCLDSPAPNLEEIYASDSLNRALLEPSHAPPILFGGHTPRLRKLYLSYVWIPLDSPMLTNLVYLQIEHILYIRSQPIQLIKVLGACPALETVQLTNLRFLAGSFIPTMLVNLFHLKKFILYEMPLNVVRYILASITTLPTTHLVLNLADATLNTTYPSDVDLATRSPSIARIRHFYASSRYDPLERDNIVIKGYDGPEREGSAQLMTLEFQNLQPPAMETVLPSLERLPMPLLESVELVDFSHATFTPAKLASFLANFTTITTLPLRDEATRFAHILIFTAESRLCPALRTLRIWRSDIRAKKLVKLVKSRQASDCHLEAIELRDCKSINRAGVEKLEALSVMVKWFEEEHMDTPLDPSAAVPGSSG
ncbi:hypothetical protein BOTBODRAFT_190320 [Botryobasidium botryosum FD-172 SS1]|uniref:F-box domain-containing protein n=1 Tax=Botryobasidium botryosum (strain FD-172 SS1) TaxID=930990 RepID=A0A067MFJ7_BOTB1|nr:hypothetical protein BOTBODRAFT_190320 [Botryobasidium botryosum FD-172 SS1]